MLIPVMSPLGSLGGRQLTVTVPDTLWLIDTVTDRGAELGAVTASIITTRHRASTSMYSLTFRVRVATPAQYGRNAELGAVTAASQQYTSRRRSAVLSRASMPI